MDDWIAEESHSFRDKLDAMSHLWSRPVVNPLDALFFETQGRYLWLKVEWIGSERHTPSCAGSGFIFPARRCLSYLPAVYQEEESSSDFLARYLSLFGTLFDSVEQQIDGMAEQFDPERVKGKQLRWLASWLGLESDEHWQDEWVRALIRAAPELYRYRGTRRGIEKLVETFTGMKPIDRGAVPVQSDAGQRGIAMVDGQAVQRSIRIPSPCCCIRIKRRRTRNACCCGDSSKSTSPLSRK